MIGLQPEVEYVNVGVPEPAATTGSFQHCKVPLYASVSRAWLRFDTAAEGVACPLTWV